MSEAIKPTPGHWILDDADPDDAYRYVVHGDGDTFGCICRISTNGNANPEDDARLIAEAGTVHYETGLTPRQLVERVKELEDTLCSLAGRFLRCAAAGISAAEAYDSFYRDDVTEVLSKALPNAAAKEAGK